MDMYNDDREGLFVVLASFEKTKASTTVKKDSKILGLSANK